MVRRYYSLRTKPGSITLEELYRKIQNLYLMFRNKDYFKKKAGITEFHFPDTIQHEAAVALTFQPFPIAKWSSDDITEDHIFDTLEFLYDYASKPGELTDMTTDTGYNYRDYGDYDDEAGQKEFRDKVNAFLADYKTGFELTKDGIVLALGTGGLQHILDAEIIPYDEINVDSKVRNAISKWRNRHLSLSEKKNAIQELADVFEWLKDTQNLGSVLKIKDESMIFNIANNFGIRHHNSLQKTNYDHTIWYSWIFHFYLATYHATIRLLLKKEKSKLKV
ncbi:MAG: hypothetical protein CVU77_06420 [Elusimicrobia bacterium HGW-Elusimicrobia-1]|jgi:hypothetical protein|nr:MAG: hypothetical protein CVU77_06420 [Elusimicrobia bacterium HGW-Elusimicrobia-1]